MAEKNQTDGGVLTEGTNGSGEGHASISGVELLILRVDHSGTILYANSALVRYLGVPKHELLGSSSEVISHLLPPDWLKEMSASTDGETRASTVTDASGAIFEVRGTARSGYLDLVWQDVTSQEQLKQFVSRYIPVGDDGLDNPDLSTFRFPERRFMTVSYAKMRSFTSMAEAMSPEDVRLTVNAYLEEAVAAIQNNGATVDQIAGDEVMALFGAPRHYNDHALRSLKTACDQMLAHNVLMAQMIALGKQMPACGIGLNTGEMILGSIGGSVQPDYTVMGASVDLARRLCNVASEGQILLTEATLREAFNALPEDWDIVSSEEEEEFEIPDELVETGFVYRLVSGLRHKAYWIGPDITHNAQAAEYRFDYLFAIKATGFADLIPVLCVQRLLEEEASLQLTEATAVQPVGHRMLGRYRLLEIVGRGGMGEVWKATDQFGNFVAIKILLAGEGASDTQLRRFKREAEIMAKLNHRNICRIFEVGQADGVNFIAMEYIEGAPLSAILNYSSGDSSSNVPSDLGYIIRDIMESVEEENPYDFGIEGGAAVGAVPVAAKTQKEYLRLPIQQTISTVIQICEAIQRAHEKGVLHRDLKPGNIMIRPDGEPVVMDFGLAKFEQENRELSLSFSGQIVGTIEYMAPEQAQSSKDVDERADVYSIGAILYQMLTGRKHYYATGNLLVDAQELQVSEPVRPRTLNSAVETDLEIITLKALRGDPGERYRSADAFRDDLDRFRSGEVISAKDVTFGEVLSKWYKRNKPLAISLIAFGTLFVASLGASLVILKLQRDAAIEAEQLAIQNEREAVEARRFAEEAARRAQAAEEKAKEKNRELQEAIQTIREQGDTIAQSRSAQLYWDALSAWRRRDMDTAHQRIVESIKLDDSSARAWFLQGRIELVKLDFESSIRSMKKAAKLQANPFARMAAPLIEVIERYQKIVEAQPSKMLRPHQIIGIMRDLRPFPEEYTVFVLEQQQAQADLARALVATLEAVNPDAEITEDKIDLAVTGDKVSLRIHDLPKLKNLNPLSEFAFFTEFQLHKTAVSDLSPLAEAPIQSLIIESSPVADISALAQLPLERLRISDIEEFSLKPLAQKHIKWLSLSGVKPRDLETIGSFPLSNLTLIGINPPTSIWSELKLRHVQVSDSSFNNLQPLRSQTLTSLNVSDSGITRLDPLTNQALLRALDIANTNVARLDPLADLPLENLDISGTKVNQLDALENVPLRVLRMRGCRILDLAPLANMPLQVLELTPLYVLRGFDVLEKLPSLKTIVVEVADRDGKPRQKTYKGDDAVKQFLADLDKGIIEGVELR